MAELKACFEALGFGNVKTYINSGNVIFTYAKTSDEELVRQIEAGIKKKFKMDICVVVRTLAQIEALCKKIPMDWDNKTMKTDVLFLWSEVDNKKVLSGIVQNKDVDTLLYIAGAVVWNINREHYTKSAMHKFIGTKVYRQMTARNINTVRKLEALMKAM